MIVPDGMVTGTLDRLAVGCCDLRDLWQHGYQIVLVKKMSFLSKIEKVYDRVAYQILMKCMFHNVLVE